MERVLQEIFRLKKEGNETVTKCYQLKMAAWDGKLRSTDVADTEQLFRLVQSIPSKRLFNRDHLCKAYGMQ